MSDCNEAFCTAAIVVISWIHRDPCPDAGTGDPGKYSEVFMLVDSIMLRPLSFPQQRQLMRIVLS